MSCICDMKSKINQFQGTPLDGSIIRLHHQHARQHFDASSAKSILDLSDLFVVNDAAYR